MKLLMIAALILLGMTFPASAGQRYLHAHPDCNILWPCEGVTTSPRGEKVVRAMRGFGTATKVYATREPVQRHRHRQHHAKLQDRFPSTPAEKVTEKVAIGDGIVRASTGALAYVAKHATAAFQCVIDKLEAAGYRIKEMGGFANRGHIPGSLHYRGLALDVNQLERNVTAPKMPSNEIELANGCGLISGAQWRNADSGHFQLGGYDGQPRRYARARHYRTRIVDARRLE
jgi:hypothetical protein